MGSSPVAVTSTLDFASVLEKQCLDIQPNIERGFNVKSELDVIKLYSQIELTEKFSQDSAIIGPIWLTV